RTLAAAVGITPAHRIVLAVGVVSLAIFVALVTGCNHHYSHARHMARNFQHMRSTYHIGGVCIDWPHVGFTDKRLRGEMKNNVRLEPAHGRLQGGKIAQIGMPMFRYYAPDIGDLE